MHQSAEKHRGARANQGHCGKNKKRGTHSLGCGNVPPYLQRSRWLVEVARDGKGPRTPHLVINNILGILRACQRGIGIAMLPDYLVEENGGLVQLFGEAEAQARDAYFVYPEELKTVARVQAFRDFLVANAQRWNF